MNFKKGAMVLSMTGLLLSGGMLAEAGTSWSTVEHNWVPGSNGTASTASQTKAVTNASSDLSISYISVENKVDTRAVGGGKYGVVSGAWVRDTNVGSYAIPNPTENGWGTQLELSSDYFSDGVSVSTKWRSN